jgi:ABC-2 type transport system permease protein
MSWLRLISLTLWQSTLEMTSYPFSFWTGLVLKLLRISLLVVFIEAIFQRTATVAGWTLDEVLLMVGCFYGVDLLTKATFFRNLLFHLPIQIRRGEFDQFLIRPVPLLASVSFRKLDVLDLLTLVPVVLLVGWQLGQLGILSPGSIVTFVGLLGVGYLVLFAIALLGSSLYFRSPEGEGIAWVVNEIAHVGRLPVTVYPRPITLTLLYVVPIALVSLVPVGVVTGKLSAGTATASALAGLGLFAASVGVWYNQVRRYESASG